jgi:hypothetical protein
MALRIPAVRGCDSQTIVVVDMAERASHIRVPAGQQETCRTVVKLGIYPIIKEVASGAVCGGKRGSGRWMHGIRGFLPIGKVAGRASRR